MRKAEVIQTIYLTTEYGLFHSLHNPKVKDVHLKFKISLRLSRKKIRKQVAIHFKCSS